jgi:hypothetical protein
MNPINLKGKISTWPETEMTCDQCERALAGDRVMELALRVTPGSVKSYVHWTCRRRAQT